MAKISAGDVKRAGLQGLFFVWWRDAVWANRDSGYKLRNDKIRRLMASGHWTQGAIGALFDLNASSVSLIVRDV